MKFFINFLLITVFTSTSLLSCVEENPKKIERFFIKDGYLRLTGLKLNIRDDKEYANTYIESKINAIYQQEIKDFINSLTLISDEWLISLIRSYSDYVMSTYENRISEKKVQAEKHILTNKWHAMEKLVKNLQAVLFQTYQIERCITAQEKSLIDACQNKNNISKNYTAINNELQKIKHRVLSNNRRFNENIDEFNELIRKNKIVLGVKEEWSYSDYIPDLSAYKPDCLTQ